MTDLMERTQVTHDEVTCSAPRHDSARAWREGCRSAAAVDAIERVRAAKRASENRRRRPAATEAQAERGQRNWLLHGLDPRTPWREGTRTTKVDRSSLTLLLHGFADRPGRHEQAVALATLIGRRPGDRPLSIGQAAGRIGVSTERAIELLGRFDPHQRTARRLADVQRRMQIAARRAEATRLRELAHRRLGPSAVHHVPCKRSAPCRRCGAEIALGVLHRAEVYYGSDGRASVVRVCAECSAPPIGCAVCGRTREEHDTRIAYEAPSTLLHGRRRRYRAELRRGRMPRDVIGERFVYDRDLPS